MSRLITEADFRAAGFTEAARQYPLFFRQFLALCAFNGVSPEHAPAAWRLSPNAYCRDNWASVVDAAPLASDALVLANAWLRKHQWLAFPNDLTLKAWTRVFFALKEAIE